MKLDYLEYQDLSDALISGLHSARRFAKTSLDEDERKYWEEKEDRTLRWLAGWDHTTIENLVSIFQRTRGRD